MTHNVARFICAALATLLAGCACTAVGCLNQVRFHVELDLAAGVEYEVTACINAECHTALLITDDRVNGVENGPFTLWPDEDRVDFDIGAGDFQGEHRVSFTLRGAERRLLAEFEDALELQRSQPNGAFCEPVCWHADLGIEPAVRAT